MRVDVDLTSCWDSSLRNSHGSTICFSPSCIFSQDFQIFTIQQKKQHSSNLTEHRSKTSHTSAEMVFFSVGQSFNWLIGRIRHGRVTIFSWRFRSVVTRTLAFQSTQFRQKEHLKKIVRTFSSETKNLAYHIPKVFFPFFNSQ